MKLGSVVWSQESSLGIYMYPHKNPVELDTKCSILSRDNMKIHHVPYKDLKSYLNLCWCCHTTVNSMNSDTCSNCHWVICPDCGACKRPKCESDGIVVLEASNPYGWEEITGFNNKDFFHKDINKDYFCIAYDNFFKIEEYYSAFLSYDIYPIIVVHDTGFTSLHIEKIYIDIVDDLVGDKAKSVEDKSLYSKFND